MNALILFLCTIWGVNWVFMKLGNAYFPPVLFSFYRFLIGSLVMIAVCYWQKVPWPKKEELKWHAVCGFLQITYMYVISQQALNHIHVAVTSLLVFSMPLWFAVLAHYYIPGEKLNAAKVTGLVIGVIGLVFVLKIDGSAFTGGGKEWIVELLVLSAAFAWALSNLIVAKKVKSQNKVQFATSHIIFGTVGLLLCSLLFERDFSVDWNPVSFLSVFFAGAVSSALGYILWFYILSKTDASKSSVTLFLVPVIGVLSSWLFLDETLEPIRVFGMVLVVAGIMVVTRKKKQGQPVTSNSATNVFEK